MSSVVARPTIQVSSAPNIKRALKACKDAGFSPKSIWLRQFGDIMVFFDDKPMGIELEFEVNEWDKTWSMESE